MSFFSEATIGSRPARSGVADLPQINQHLLNWKIPVSYAVWDFEEATIGFEPMNKGFADLPLKPLGYVAKLLHKRKSTRVDLGRAGDGTRTRDFNLGKVALYQLSYSRVNIFKFLMSRQKFTAYKLDNKFTDYVLLKQEIFHYNSVIFHEFPVLFS